MRGETITSDSALLADHHRSDAGPLVERCAGPIFDDAPIGMGLVRPDGRFLRANAALCAFTGYSEPELLTRTFQDITHPDDLALDLRHVRRALAGEIDGYSIEKRYLRADGRAVWAVLSASAVRDDAGQVQCFIKQVQDIDGYKRMAEQLQTTNRELEAAARAKDEFLASMSHELRTPLNSILGFTDILLMELPGALTGEQRQQLDIVHANGKQLLSLINDLLDLAKLQSGRYELSPEPVDGGSLVDEVVDSLRPLAAQQALTLAAVAASPAPTTWCDRRALSQVLLNLTANAIKFTEHGGVTVRVEPVAGGVRFSVADTGPGLSEDELALAFVAYRRLDSGGLRRSQGTGLGLHISQRLADLMGARLTVHSTPGAGATFALTVPHAATH
ncbi:MAG: sensor histidine kinase [Jatrophihabitans sp.]|uniref:sensor histidine kinase n=1 Tax=Jatrophihabitans sp. TaxID=1932789 RepID=UPI003F816A5F